VAPIAACCTAGAAAITPSTVGTGPLSTIEFEAVVTPVKALTSAASTAGSPPLAI